MIEPIEFVYDNLEIDSDTELLRPAPDRDLVRKVRAAQKTNMAHAFGEAAYQEIIDWIAATHSPEEVFDIDLLEYWAESNGWSKR